MDKKYKVVISGLGDIAWKYNQKIKTNISLTHAETYIKNSRCMLAGGFSPDEEDRRDFKSYYRVPVFKTIDDLISNVKPDIVSICSPSDYHFEQVDYCLEVGIPMIWLEKPPAIKVQQLEYLIDKQKKKLNTTILVNFQRRYSNIYNEFKRQIQNNFIGKVLNINVFYSRGLLNNGSHIIDVLNFIMGDVKFESSNIIIKTNNENASFILKYPSNVMALINGLELPYHCLDISATGEKGRISVLYGGMDYIWEEKIEHEFYPGFYRLNRNANKSIESNFIEDSMDKALNDLILSHETGRNPKSNLYTALNTLSIIENIINI